MTFIHHTFYFFVDRICYRFTVVALTAQITAQEYLFTIVVAKCDSAQLIGHPPLGHHTANDTGCTFDIVGSPCTDFIQHQFFCYTTAQHHNYLLTQMGTCHIVAVFCRQEQCIAACTTARNDRYFVYRVFTRQQIAT